MEYLDGKMLKHGDRQPSMDLETLLSLGIEISDALDAAHAEASSTGYQAGKYFRDPAWHAKVLDFGWPRSRPWVAEVPRGRSQLRRLPRRVLSTSPVWLNVRNGCLHVSRAGQREGTRRAH